MKRHILPFALISLVFYGCQVLKPNNIKYNERKEIYEYSLNKKQSMILRNDSIQLITDSNIEQFRLELEQKKFRYPSKHRLENSKRLRNSDVKLTATYSNISNNILNNDYELALNGINDLKAQYPDVIKYSDVLFLEGYCHEKLQNTDSSGLFYSDFLKYSSGKYSANFRGYRDFDKNDSLWLLQRDYTRNYFLDINPSLSEDIFKTLEPRYFYSTFHPGYNIPKA